MKSLMWESLKNIIGNFIFKEVEVDQEREGQRVSEQSYGTEKYRLSSIDDQSTDVKIRYQYPRKETGAFRFPVIPDDSYVDDFETDVGPDRMRNAKSRIEQPFQQPTTLKNSQRHSVSKELDEVPAFLRRNPSSSNKKQKTNEIQREETVENDEEEKPVRMTILPHTKPDELDAIFKKRDGKLDTTREKKQIPVNETEVSRIKKKDTVQEDDHLQQLADNVRVESETAASLTTEKETNPVNHTSTANEGRVPDRAEKTLGATEKPMKQPIKQDFPHPVDHVTQPYSEKSVGMIEKETAPEVPDYLLNDNPNPSSMDDDWLIEQQILLEDTFTHFNIDATVVNVTQGPSVTRFEIQPALGVKVSKIKNLSDDLKLNLAAKDIRIEAPIPGRNTIGIEIPNKTMHLVNLQELFEAGSFKNASSPLTIALGLTIEGEPIFTNIDKMPHGLIAGATGSGKSVCINTIILSLLYKANHHDVKLLLIDPKMVELTPYNNIPHLISPVITDVKAATKALKWAVDEMESRYHKFVELGVRNIQKFNEKVKQGQTEYEKMSYIVIVIDELADLMMVSPQEVEDAICRIAQKARACGIHLLLATQRPSVDVITGLIKANIPTRIAFSVSSQVDSRTMIDSNGAEKLLGKGDMLFLENGAGKAVRLQGPFVSDEEIDRVTSYVRSIAEPEYLFEEEQLLMAAEEDDMDELLGEVIQFVVSHQQASTSLLQRQFRIGYNRAARLIDSLEAKGIISGQNGSKPREVLVTEEQIDYR